MSQPTIYDRVYNFAEYQALHPTAPLPAAQVDLEFNTVKITLDQTLANLALIQRDDGQLANNSVGADQLKPEITIAFNPPSVWTTATAYAVRDYVFVGAVMYRALIAHASGDFTADLAAGKWIRVAQFVGNKVASIDALNMSSDQGLYFSDANTANAYSLTPSGRSLGGLTTTGFTALTSLSVAATRAFMGTANEITVANGDGIAGNPVLSLPAALSFVGKTIDQGTFNNTILTGSPVAPTVANSVSNTNLATTAFVKSVRLDQFAVPTATVSFNAQKISNVLDPTAAQDAATKNYVDGVSQGLTPKQSVACASTANLTLSGEQTIDGVLTSGSRVLVKNQTTPAQNGIYVSAAGAWARALDLDTWAEVPSAYTFVSAGTTQASTGWVCTSTSGGTLGTTAITFSQFSGAGTYSAGANITLAGTVFSVSLSPTFTTPNIGVATATSVNKMAITAPATASTLTIADSKTFTVQKTLTFTGTDGQSFTFPVASGVVLTADSTNTLTNKTFDTAGAGNSLSVNGVVLNANNGTGAMVRDTNASLTTPTLGVATATSINKVAITAPAASATLTIANLKTLTANNTLTLAGTDGTTLTFQGTDTYVGRASVDTLTNKTLTAPAINGGAATGLTGLAVRSTGAAFDLTLASAEVLTAGRTLTISVADAARTLALAGNLSFAGALTTAGAFATTLTMTAATNVTLPTSGTLSTLAGVETLLNKTLTSPVITNPALGVATATSINKVSITAPATGATLTIADGKTLTVPNTLTLAGTDGTTLTMPAATDTLLGRASVDTITGAKTFNDAKLILAGLTSGSTTLKAAAVAGATTITLPAATDTLVGKATTDTLTNKTFDTAGAGNSFLVNGVAITAVTGTGANVLSVSPALTGTPTVPTQTAGNNSTAIASTAFVQAAVTAGTAGVVSVGGAGGIITLRGGSVPAQELTVPRYDAAQTLTAGEIAQILKNIAAPVLPQGRLTLQTTTPVMTTSQSAKTTIFYTAYQGTLVPVYDGTNFLPSALPGGEISVATTDTTKNPAAIGASKVNDWFVWNDAGTLRLTHGPDWTSDTARSAGTALALVNGILLNSVAITNGPAASRGTYVGTTRSNASSQLDWILGTAAASGGAASLNVWNTYNRVNVATQVQDTTASWTYSGTFRSANGSNTNRVSYVMGLAEDFVAADFKITQEGTAAVFGAAGVGHDSTVSASGGFCDAYSGASALRSSVGGSYSCVDLGYHYMQALEYGGGATIFYGFKTSPQVTSMALTWQGRM